MAILRALLFAFASPALVAVATAGSAQLPNSGSGAGNRTNLIAMHAARQIPLGFDYRLVDEPVAIPAPGIAAVATTIPEPPLGATLAGAAVIGFVYWTRRRRA